MDFSYPYPGSSDEKLVWQRFLAGQPEAFEKLMSTHFRSLFQYGSKFSKDKEFVKDSIQDLFLILWEKRENLSSDIVVKSYLMASLRRLMHRSTTTRSRLFDNASPEDEGVFEIEFSVEEHYIESESAFMLTEKVRKMLSELPRRQKEVVYLKFFQDLDRNQISEVMEVSPQTVSNLLQIAIKQLRTYWKAEFLILLTIHLFI
ncbi:RNA polymerase sigma factor [Dyadobacter psychrotolerans]|uniref:Sigma-70 family RNA polymerase sigma factor n=1 Tax=Dyadobacter psychrotolerans TaxID=2541721 RepID=A0A4R5E0P6_9BACT|nr:sigma-70 family RNA polymerase sigma factor [Dyadobacter psychrotolerans]TDE17173.1 sigma-70 family RNA polymerase sigma factor [Dyadobacter psychrotolerans]